MPDWLYDTGKPGVFLLVTVYTFTATPIYEATTKLLIEAENPNVVSFKEVIDEQAAKLDYYQTQYNILQSRSLARRTMDTLKLWDHEDGFYYDVLRFPDGNGVKLKARSLVGLMPLAATFSLT